MWHRLGGMLLCEQVWMTSGYITYVYPSQEVLLPMCCRSLWPPRCHERQRYLCEWAQRWPGRSASKVGSSAATHARL